MMVNRLKVSSLREGFFADEAILQRSLVACALGLLRTSHLIAIG
jgi:hypothetical protein